MQDYMYISKTVCSHHWYNMVLKNRRLDILKILINFYLNIFWYCITDWKLSVDNGCLWYKFYILFCTYHILNIHPSRNHIFLTNNLKHLNMVLKDLINHIDPDQNQNTKTDYTNQYGDLHHNLTYISNID